LCRYPAMKAADLNGKNPQTCYARDTEVFRIFEDSKDGIWASAQLKGGDSLMRWDPVTKALVTFPLSRIPGRKADELVSSFAEDPQGNIWMGLYHGGLDLFDGHEFHHFGQSDGVPGGTVYSVLANKSGLWFGSNGGGLGHLSMNDGRPHLEIYSKSRGLSSNIIYCIVADKDGYIYAGTSNGVDRVDPATGHLRHFSSADGLAHGELTSALRDRSGSLWFATKQGLSRLLPSGDRAAANPRVLITDLRVAGALYPVSQLGESRISLADLAPSQNQLQVDFAGLDYEPGEVLRYSYKLEGADADWSPPRSSHSVNYAALAGNKYRFLVKAVTAEGLESTAPAEVSFAVMPPVWKRSWFQALALAIVIGFVFSVHKYRVNHMLQVERMRTGIAIDLHDDIGAGLSQIAILTEVARRTSNGSGPPGELLERVAILARELADSMGDIVWSIRSEPHGIDSLVRRMREFGLDMLTRQGVDFDLKEPPAGETVELSLETRRQLFLAFKECIHNAARHSNCSIVNAELKVSRGEIVLTVADNGTGLKLNGKPAGSSGGNGIPGMRRRAEGLGGRMEVVSTPGGGCRVEIRLPAGRGVFAKSSS